MLTKTEKNELKLFLKITLGTLLFMTYLIWITRNKHYYSEVFAITQMLYPMATAIIIIMTYRKEDANIPRKFFLYFLGFTIFMSVLCIGNALFSLEIIEYSLNTIIIVGSLLSWAFLYMEDYKKREAYRLDLRINKFFILIILFLILNFASEFFQYFLWNGWNCGFKLHEDAISSLLLNLLIFPLTLFTKSIIFLGEEYGWRLFLQPLLQKRFGMRKGVFLLGIIWGIWHFPVNFLDSGNDGSNLGQMIVSQIIFCIAMSIFYGYAYLKSHNIWLPVTLHFLTNMPLELIESNIPTPITWEYVIISLIPTVLLFIPFIISPVFSNKKV